jgi:hypothetical protein
MNLILKARVSSYMYGGHEHPAHPAPPGADEARWVRAHRIAHSWGFPGQHSRIRGIYDALGRGDIEEELHMPNHVAIPLVFPSTRKSIDAHESQPIPTDSQIHPKRASRPRSVLAHREIHGLKIHVENPAGTTRQGTDRDGKQWKTVMRNDYGYLAIPNLRGKDGDAIDCYLGPDPEATRVYVVNQTAPPAFTAFDEQKVMLGFPTKDEAIAAYLAHHDNPRFMGSTVGMSVEEFKKKIAGKPTVIKSRLVFRVSNG